MFNESLDLDHYTLKCNICKNNYFDGDFFVVTDGTSSELICKNCIVDESNKVLNEHRKNSNAN